VARIHTASITLCALLFTTLTFTPLANASEQTRGSAVHKTTHLAKASESKKKPPQKKHQRKAVAPKQKQRLKPEIKKWQ
jgi:murein DD-endopeptidase